MVFFPFHIQMYFHYNVVQQLKNLHDVSLYPDLFPETSSLTPAGFPTKGEKGGGGKKGEDKSGGGSKRGGGPGGGASKDKRSTKPKEDPGKSVCIQADYCTLNVCRVCVGSFT